MLWVAAARPVCQPSMAIGWALMFASRCAWGDSAYRIPMMKMADAGVQINAILMFLNLIPVPPLDEAELPSACCQPIGGELCETEPWVSILLLLLVTGMLEAVLGPLVALFRYSL